MLRDFDKKNNYKNIKMLGVIIVLLISVILTNACSEAVSEKPAETDEGVTAREILENPAAFDSKTVTVSGDVERVFEPRAFNIDSGIADGELLVIGQQPFPKVPDENGRGLTNGDIATVTGVVKIFKTKEDFEREIGWDLTPDIGENYVARPVLIARHSEFRAGKLKSGEPAPAADADIDETTEAAEQREKTIVKQPVTDTEVVNFSDFERAVDRKSYVGKRIRLEAVNVESVAGDRAFFVGTSPAQRVLIVFEEERTPGTPIEGKVDIDRGQKVTIDGVVRQMPSVAEAKRRFGHLMSAETLNSLRNEDTYIYTDDPKIVKNS